MFHVKAIVAFIVLFLPRDRALFREVSFIFKSIMVGFGSRLLEPKKDVGCQVMEGLCGST